MRKVIFVGGTSFSGSTAFHLMLANDPGGFACGETESLFFPRRDGHVRRLNDCRPESLAIWRKAYAVGAERVYAHLFESMPDVEFIVDSSKNPHWIRMQHDQLTNQGIEACHFLIWKTPLEFARSRKKRKMLDGWQKEWRNAHRVYFTLIDHWRAVQYQQLATDPEIVLPAVCDSAGLRYFQGKADFWHHDSHHLGGNYSARVHLHRSDVAQKFSSQWIADNRMQYHQRVYYQAIEDNALKERVAAVMDADPRFEHIQESLLNNDVVGAPNFVSPRCELYISAAERAMRSARESYRIWTGNRRYAESVSAILNQDRLESVNV